MLTGSHVVKTTVCQLRLSRIPNLRGIRYIPLLTPIIHLNSCYLRQRLSFIANFVNQNWDPLGGVIRISIHLY